MKIEQEGDSFVIYKSGGKYSADPRFCFYVDHDSACWSKRAEPARFSTREKAEEALAELRQRDKIRRQEAALRKVSA